MLDILNRFKIQAAVIALCGLTWGFCPWFAQLRSANDKDCACEVCMDSCEHMDGDVCDCHDNGCGCPMCVPVE